MDSVITYLKKIIKPNDYVIVGVSGGPDSMALLTVLKNVSTNVICAHVNHNVRVESKDEEKFVKNYCQKINVTFESMTIKNYNNENFHQEARHIRYQFFEDLIKKYHAKYLLTAHHGDDLIETILMRITRGSTLKGYSGFSKEIDKENYKILKPLIELTKDEIIAFNKKNNIDYVIDSSNNKDTYTRNRFRKNVLPFLKKENANIVHKFYQYSKTLQNYDKYIKKISNEIKKNVYNNRVLDIDLFKENDQIIQKEILYLIFQELYKRDLYYITERHINLLSDLIYSKKANSMIYLPNKISAFKSYNLVAFEKETEEIKSYEFELKDKVNLPNGKNIEIINECEEDDNFICRLNLDQVKWPLFIRTRHNGDKMEVKKLAGHKKINDIFIDNKIPIKQRNSWPIVTDSNGTIIWLPGLKKSKFDKIKKEKYDIILKYY